MASAWGLSWGSSWGGSWGALPIARRGGRFIFDREPDPEIRREKVQELKRLIKPLVPPKPTASVTQEPQETLTKTLAAATSAMPRFKQRRVDRLMQQTGISLQELLIILEIS